RFRQFVRGDPRIGPGKEHCLGGVDVAETAYLGLIKKEFFQGSFACKQGGAKIVVRKIVTERFRRKLADLFCFVQSVRVDDLHQPEMTLVLKDETRSVFEMKDGMSEFRIL